MYGVPHTILGELRLLRVFSCPRKSATTWVVMPWYKRVLWLLVIYCILYVLISPLPEDDATLSGSSVMTLFVLVTYALLSVFVLDLSTTLRPSGQYRASQTQVLDKTCVRLC